MSRYHSARFGIAVIQMRVSVGLKNTRFFTMRSTSGGKSAGFI